MSRRIWVRASLFAVLGVLTALASILLRPLIPVDIPGKVGAEAVGNILNILASSMLAVTTFSLSVMVASFSSATQNVTPRATRLLMQDNTSQNVLSIFVGSFLFSLVGLITLGMGAYGGSGRVVLYAVTLGVIILIVVAILRWIGHLSEFGRVGDTIRRVEDAARQALDYRVDHPSLGGMPLENERGIPKGAWPIEPRRIGYVDYIDIASLDECAEENDCEFYLVATPGHFVDLHAPLTMVMGAKGTDEEQEDLIKVVRNAFSLDQERSFDQDPRFGLSVLSEIASRALSPAINDTGTAIDVIGRAVRLLSEHAKARTEAETKEVKFKHIHVPPVQTEELFEEAFAPIARDGASIIQVQIQLQKGFDILSKFGGNYESAAKAQSEDAYARAMMSLTAKSDKDRLKQLVK